MAQLDDLNAGLTAIADAATALGDDVGKLITALSVTPTPTDLTAPIAAAKAIQDGLAATAALAEAALAPPATPPAVASAVPQAVTASNAAAAKLKVNTGTPYPGTNPNPGVNPGTNPNPKGNSW